MVPRARTRTPQQRAHTGGCGAENITASGSVSAIHVLQEPHDGHQICRSSTRVLSALSANGRDVISRMDDQLCSDSPMNDQLCCVVNTVN